MAHLANPQLLTLAGLAHRCAEETDRFFHRQSHDPRFCFELFRRAILHRNEHAWRLVYDRYRPLVAGWVERHPAYAASGEEGQYFVNRAFEKMWLALGPEKFERFPDLKSLLSYLQMCVHSAIVDEARSSGPPVADVDGTVLAAGPATGHTSIEDLALARAQRADFWHLISVRLNDEKERLVVHGSFVLALKPRELYAEFQDVFENVDEVYRIKQNVLDRFRRDRELQALLG